MTGVLGLVESAAGAKLSEWGTQLALLGGVALFLGALRLYLADRTRARLVLLAGLSLFAVGGTLRSLEGLGVIQLNYYPGWREDFEEVLLKDHAEMEYSDEDLETVDPRAAWWEGVVWWGQRLGLTMGAGLAAAGLALDARGIRDAPRRGTKRAGKRAGR